jgi:hypothetical protein
MQYFSTPLSVISSTASVATFFVRTISASTYRACPFYFSNFGSQQVFEIVLKQISAVPCVVVKIVCLQAT